MKKVLLIAAVAVFGLSSANAQEFGLGAKAGVNFATVGGDATDNIDGVTSFHVGLVGEFMFTDEFGIQPEVLYSGQGWGSEFSSSEEINGEIWSESEENTMKLNYISVPIMAKYYLMEGLYVNAGPQVSFLVSAEADSDYTSTQGDISESGSESEDVKDAFNTVDFGLSVGAGYKLDMGLFFDARYYLGLSNIRKEIEDVPSDFDVEEFKNQNRVFQVSVGWMF